jgi:transcription elongation factor Elf1
MNIFFKCPTCRRVAHYMDVSVVATEIRDRTCQHCGNRWRFKIVPLAHRRNQITIHEVISVAHLSKR